LVRIATWDRRVGVREKTPLPQCQTHSQTTTIEKSHVYVTFQVISTSNTQSHYNLGVLPESVYYAFELGVIEDENEQNMFG